MGEIDSVLNDVASVGTIRIDIQFRIRNQTRPRVGRPLISTCLSRYQVASLRSPSRTRQLSMPCRLASAETLQTIAANPKWLGVEIGVTALFHTWGQATTHHPMSPASCRAEVSHQTEQGGSMAGRASFYPFACCASVSAALSDSSRATLRPVRAALRQSTCSPQRQERFQPRSRTCSQHRMGWPNQSPPFGGANQVLAYLARHIHRVAIATAASFQSMTTMSPPNGRITVERVANVRRSCVFNPTSVEPVRFRRRWRAKTNRGHYSPPRLRYLVLR